MVLGRSDVNFDAVRYKIEIYCILHHCIQIQSLLKFSRHKKSLREQYVITASLIILLHGNEF